MRLYLYPAVISINHCKAQHKKAKRGTDTNDQKATNATVIACQMFHEPFGAKRSLFIRT